jgi:type 1 glutamine amidotransferase
MIPRWFAFMLTVTALDFVQFGAAQDKTKPLEVCLVAGSKEYDPDVSLAKLQQHLEKNYQVRCTRAFTKGKDYANLPGLENLDTCDVMVLFTRRLTIEGEQLERVKKYCLAGKPIVGIRTASHAFQNWLDLDKEVLGGNYKGHYEVGPITAVSIEDKTKGHPILKGVRPFKSVSSLYRNTGLASDVDILLTGTIPGHSEPLAWTRNYKGGRIFYTSLGHVEDFAEPNFVTMLVNAIHWTAKRDPVMRKGP